MEKEKSFSELWDNIKQTYMQLESQKERRERNGQKKN